jgi:hypothetical protein
MMKMKNEQFFYQVLQAMELQWNKIDRGKPTPRRKTCPSATLSTTSPTWTDPRSNPGLRSERQAINRLSHGTAFLSHTTDVLKLGDPTCSTGKASMHFYRNIHCTKTGHKYVSGKVLRFHGNTGYKKAPQHYVTSTLLILFVTLLFTFFFNVTATLTSYLMSKPGIPRALSL